MPPLGDFSLLLNACRGVCITRPANAYGNSLPVGTSVDNGADSKPCTMLGAVEPEFLDSALFDRNRCRFVAVIDSKRGICSSITLPAYLDYFAFADAFLI